MPICKMCRRAVGRESTRSAAVHHEPHLAGVGAMDGGAGNDTYMMAQGSASVINPSANQGVDEVYLPAGRSFADFQAHLSGPNLLLQSLDGKTSVTIDNYVDPARRKPGISPAIRTPLN